MRSFISCTLRQAYYNCEVKEYEMGRACSTNRAKMHAYRIIVGKPEGKRPLRRQRRMWVDNIKMYLRVIGWGEHCNESSGSIKIWEVHE
jgi:hypothetical protein